VEKPSPPTRNPPSAAAMPPFLERGGGLPREEFLQSDESKPDLSEALRECPLTIWDFEDIDVNKDINRNIPSTDCPHPVTPPNEGMTLDEERAYFKENQKEIREQLLEHGSLWIRGFSLPKSVAGHRELYESLSLTPCLDPLHSSGLRKFASERDVVYEEVNKEGLRGHYIGLHQESTSKRTAAYAAFVCWQTATDKTEPRGRFLIADGKRVLARLPPALLQKLYDRQVRISVSNLDLPASTPGALKGVFKTLVDKAITPKFDMDLEMIYGVDGTSEGRLMAVESRESPINRHPITKEPVWFCNAHNHLRYLRDRRPTQVPEVGMTDVFFGDLGRLEPEECEAIKRASEESIVSVPMEEGDVILVDNYRVLHGRDIFKGDRFHAVSWFTWDDFGGMEGRRGDELRIRGKDGLNKIVNKYMDFLPKEF